MMPSGPVADSIAGSSLTRSGRAASMCARATRPQPCNTSWRQPISAIDQPCEGAEPPEDRQKQKPVGDRKPGWRPGPMLHNRDLQVPQHPGDYEWSRQEQLVAVEARHVVRLGRVKKIGDQ